MNYKSKSFGILELSRIKKSRAKNDRSSLSRWAQSFVGWVSDSVTHAGVGFRASTASYSIFNSITPTYL